ncbi:DUF6963 family protein [Tropicimonas isoalkanivorans]|uniref:Uncharacterized protein n=1 Tax=Tropicimonas isoalkanivorans TaxID=441112 RepID=A0A1I1IC87_9RHOB|nr:hypothetical protein [Tropicimonas isoalkanivorans]SFC33631.1 hypothetical protein SAMN04488094_10418 [Tropicimonas isoalkanivorans]
MTIGIGALGPNAGLAVFKALQAAERVGTGSIGGFAVFAAIAEDGTLHTAETQRGGTSTLFTEGETTGTVPPPSVASARRAAVMSSGPDRPSPLSQFLAADPAIGLVTGHRLPNAEGDDGVPLNKAVLAAMGRGLDAQAALAQVFEANPEADAGMIALGPHAGIAARNSRLVASRPDLGGARRTAGSATVAILHNAIAPHASLAALVADIALGIMQPDPEPAGSIAVCAGTPLVLAEAHRVIIDADGEVQRIETDAQRLLSGERNCAAIYLGAPVVRDGVVIGTTLVEPNVVVRDGRVVSLSGQARFSISYAAKRGDGE